MAAAMAAGAAAPAPTGTSPASGEPRLATPVRVYLLAGIALLLVTALSVLLIVQSNSTRSGLTQIGQRSGPEVVATADLYFAVNDMDAQLADILLDGSDPSLSVGRTQALQVFEQRRHQAVQDIQQAAAAAGEDPTAQRAVRSVLDALGSYEGLAAQTKLLDGAHPHPAGRPPAQVLDQYRQTTDLLRSTLLPAVKALTDRNAATLQSTYESKRSNAQLTLALLAVLGLAAAGALVTLHLFLAHRFRRRLNVGVAAATAVVVALLLAGASLYANEAEHLRVAKKDAFDSILALSQARAISYDANADESRYLVDPARAGQYQSAFLDKSQQLLQLPGATIGDYDGKLSSAASAYQTDHSDVRFYGLYGVGFRNITFPGERAAAERTLATYQAYERDDRRIRALTASGDLRGSIAFDTGYAPGQSNGDYGAYDQALSGWTKINQDAFDHAIKAGQDELSGWTLIPLGALFAVVLLTLAGIRPRLAEYR